MPPLSPTSIPLASLTASSSFFPASQQQVQQHGASIPLAPASPELSHLAAAALSRGTSRQQSARSSRGSWGGASSTDFREGLGVGASIDGLEAAWGREGGLLLLGASRDLSHGSMDAEALLAWLRSSMSFDGRASMSYDGRV